MVLEPALNLDDLLKDKPEDLKVLKALLIIVLLDPSDWVRNTVIANLNQGDSKFLRKLYALEGKIYAKFMNTDGKFNTIYITDLPSTYIKNQPATIHSFDLDAN